MSPWYTVVMKRITALLAGIVLFGFPVHAFAHTADQPPYMMVGGKYTAVYPVYGSTTEQIQIPNDIAADSFLVNEPVVFEINQANLPIPEDMLKNVTFSWDFGDGTKLFGGLSVSHPYKKVGSYVASTYAIPPADAQLDPVLLQTTLVNIVPFEGYHVPKSVISINGKEIRDPLVDVVKLPLTDPVSFSGQASTSEGKIVSYEWDFGDKHYKETKIPTVTYTYNLANYKYGLPLAFVVLRVKDENGLLADSYVQINNTATRTDASKTKAKPPMPLPLIVGGIVLVIVLIPVSLLTVKKRKSS